MRHGWTHTHTHTHTRAWSRTDDSCYRSDIRVTSVIHFPLRGCQIEFFINRIFDVHILLVQVTLPHSRRKIKMVRWFICPCLCPPRIPSSLATQGILLLNTCFSCDQLESLERILDDAVENINLSPHRIEIRLPVEDDIDCLVPGEVSVSKA